MNTFEYGRTQFFPYAQIQPSASSTTTRSCPSMSDHRRSSISSVESGSSKKKQNVPPGLRPLAPRPSAVAATRPLAPRSTTGLSQSPSTNVSRRSPAQCAVCYRVGCQLPTHTAFSNRSQSSGLNSPDTQQGVATQNDPVFTSSYAYKLAEQFADLDITTSTTGPQYDLPLGSELNTPQMHRLFHACFAPENLTMLNIPRPRSMRGEYLNNPFFLPAFRDPLLCISILAVTAASHPEITGQPAQNPLSLTLAGKAMQQMRERIAETPEEATDTTIVACLFLWMASLKYGDLDSIQSLIGTIHSFVELRGGLDELGINGAVARLVRFVDAANSFLLPMQCRYLDTSTFDAGPPVFSAKYGAYWNRVAESGSTRFATAVNRTCQESCLLLERLEHTFLNDITGVEYVKMVDQICVQLTRGSVFRAQKYEHNQLTECVCVADSLVLFQCFIGVYKTPLVGELNVARLVAAIKATGGPAFWQQDPELLIWLLFAAVMLSTNSEEKSWCLSLLCRVLTAKLGHDGRLNQGWTTRLKSLLHLFSWCDVLLEQLFQETCRAIKHELKDDSDDDEKEGGEDNDNDDDDDDDDDEGSVDDLSRVHGALSAAASR